MSVLPIRSLVKVFQSLLALFFALSVQIFSVNPVSAKPAPFTIVDTLGAATPTTQFQLAGSGGQALSSYQQVGPRFVLVHPTTITEIGAFITYCELIAGVLDCPSIRPVFVDIRPALNGQPDLNRVLGTFVLSTHNSPEVNTYESVHPNLRLKPGTYFAIFRITDDGAAGLMSSASDPFAYQAGVASVGFILQPDNRTVTGQLSLAVRVLGTHGSPHE